MRHLENAKRGREEWDAAISVHIRTRSEADYGRCLDARFKTQFAEFAAWWLDMRTQNDATRLMLKGISQEVVDCMAAYNRNSDGCKVKDFLDAYCSFHADPTDVNAYYCAQHPVSPATIEDLEKNGLVPPMLLGSLDQFAEHLSRVI